MLEDIYLKHQQLSRKVALRCQHYSTALQILQQNNQMILTIPKQILLHLSLSSNIQIFELAIELPNLNIGMYWHKEMQDNLRHQFLRKEITKIFA